MKLTADFIRTLQRTTQPILNHLYKCQNCHRPNLKPEHVALVSANEAYCIFCTNDAR